MAPSPRPRPLSRAARAQVAADNQARIANGTFAQGANAVHAPPSSALPPLHAAAPASLAVVDCDAASAALALAQRAAAGAAPPAILNFADAHQRGGGYLTGAAAQEEALCRVIPALYPALTQLAYPLDPSVAPATSAFICRTPGYPVYPIAATPTPVVVLSAAALDLRPPADGSALPSACYGAAYTAEMSRRARAVLFAAHAMGCRDLVLGAWGCGVFANDPRAIAALLCDLLRSAEWRYRFDSIVFAIPTVGRGIVSQIFSNRLHRLTQP